MNNSRKMNFRKSRHLEHEAKASSLDMVAARVISERRVWILSISAGAILSAYFLSSPFLVKLYNTLWYNGHDVDGFGEFISATYKPVAFFSDRIPIYRDLIEYEAKWIRMDEPLFIWNPSARASNRSEVQAALPASP